MRIDGRNAGNPLYQVKVGSEYSTDVDDGRALSLGRIGSSSSAFQVLTVGGVCKVPSTFDYSVIIMGSETVAFLLGFH